MMMARDVYIYDIVEWPHNSASVIVMLRAEQNKDAHLLREQRSGQFLPSMVGKSGVLDELQRIKKTISKVENFCAETLDISNDNCLANKLQIVPVSCRIGNDK